MAVQQQNILGVVEIRLQRADRLAEPQRHEPGGNTNGQGDEPELNLAGPTPPHHPPRILDRGHGLIELVAQNGAG